MKLFHFSEDPSIRVFTPRQLPYRLDEPPMVWAIDELHSYHYYFPRDCPRVCFWFDEGTTDADKAYFFGQSRTARIIAIESGWLSRLRSARLYRYVFDAEQFRLYNGNAGYYVSESEVSPEAIEPVEDCMGRLAEAGIELRITPSLMPLKEAIPASTVHFSMIRMSNAAKNG
ncbi:DUF6886 family protein [Paenibacillus sp. R14(2021)]|uniref:DUF6886 family protein n=1 Tax=Paenibacillus sp. R14(2021) TaxID=2859228 RepID=UPI0021578744|nr:DUF6886 family protein [Paenibacillus sp. R14(2021)]